MVTQPGSHRIPPGRRPPTAIGTEELPPNQPPPTAQPAPEWYIVGFRTYTPGNLLLLQRGVLAKDGTLEEVAESIVTRNIGPYPPELLVYIFGPGQGEYANSMLDHPPAAGENTVIKLSWRDRRHYAKAEAIYLKLNPEAASGVRKAIPLLPDFRNLERILAGVLL